MGISAIDGMMFGAKSMSASQLPSQGSLIGVRISVTNYAEVTRCVIEAARARRRLLVAACNVHSVMEARSDPAFAAVLNAFDITTPDGQPLRWGLRWNGQATLRERVYGPTLMLEVCREAAAAGQSIYFYGSRPDTVAALSRRLSGQFPNLGIAGARGGRFRPLTEDEMHGDAARILDSGAGIVFVGMGCPRQEWWMFHMRDRIERPMLGVGAAFDFHAGRVEQAPGVLQDRGLEWLFRLSREPRRLWRRYLVVSPQYLPLITAQALGLREFSLETDLAEARTRNCPG